MFINRCEHLLRETPPGRARAASVVIVFPVSPPPRPAATATTDRLGPAPGPDRTARRHCVRGWSLLWALAGWPGIVAAIALGAVVVVRLLGAVWLPPRLRNRSVTLALLAGLVVLLLQSPRVPSPSRSDSPGWSSP